MTSLRVATLVGCKYADTGNDLKGCINDVVAMKNYLSERFGFAEQDITIMLTDDNRPRAARATGANIKRALLDMVERARGVRGRAILFFHFSGHGTQLWAGPYVRHEAIVPCDLNLITDVDFRELLHQVPQNATFTMVSDSCHSGGLIGQTMEQEQVGPIAALNHAVDAGASGPAGAAERDLGHGVGRPRFLLRCETVRCRPPRLRYIEYDSLGFPRDFNQLRRHMDTRFAGDASALFRLAPDQVPVPRPDSGILLIAGPFSEDGADYGAFTSSLLVVLPVLRQELAPMTNRHVVTGAREVLARSGKSLQYPCLYCTADNAGAPFLG